MRFFIFFSLSAILVFSSCTKTVTNPAPVPTVDTLIVKDTLIIKDTLVVKDTVLLHDLNPIVGLWIGTLTANNEPEAGTLYNSFDIRANGSILTRNLGADGNTYYNEGTWTLSGTTFSATTTCITAPYQGVVENLTATYNKDDGTLSSGTWETVGAVATGTFSLARIN
jgi:hypothetical protein